MKYAFVQRQRRHHSVSTMCRVLRVGRSGFYAWLTREPSRRARSDRRLLRQIQQVHRQHRGHSGALKTWRVLRARGVDCGKHRVARLRSQHGIVAKRRKRFVVTTRSKGNRWVAPNLLNRDFTAVQPNLAWVGDVTFVPTRQGWLYLAVVLELYSRQVIGWSMSNYNDSSLVFDALAMAIDRRMPAAGTIYHSDQARTYSSQQYRALMKKHGIRPSMSRKGDCWDNAVAESFFATLEFELIEQQVFGTRALAKAAIFEFIEVFYNRQRAHQTLGYETPAQFERNHNVVA